MIKKNRLFNNKFKINTGSVSYTTLLFINIYNIIYQEKFNYTYYFFLINFIFNYILIIQ
jgi:hypothetical protein